MLRLRPHPARASGAGAADRLHKRESGSRTRQCGAGEARNRSRFPRRGHTRYRAIIDATVRRARPVALTALAAVLGMIPLARSIFWGPMAITIMGRLLVATVLTLLVVPALYALWFRVRQTSPTDLRSSPKRSQNTTIWSRSGSLPSDHHREGAPHEFALSRTAP